LTQLFNSARQTRKSGLPVSIARSIEQLKLARSQCSYGALDLSTAAAIEFEIELRNTILDHLGRVHSELAFQFFGNVSRNRPLAEIARRKSAKGASARPANRPNAGYRQYRIRSE